MARSPASRTGADAAAEGRRRRVERCPATPTRPDSSTPSSGPVVKATDLGSVQVLKQGNVYLLTDAFGDVHPDSRGLGLYDGDTRRLSCSILRVNDERPVLLQSSAGGNYHGAIQLTNPRLERNVADKMHPEDALASQKLGIARDRRIASGMLEERVRIENYAELDETVELTLELAADAADIFEVRGWTRAERGRQHPIAFRRDRVTFRYDGLDGRHTSTHVAFNEPADTVEPVDPAIAGSVNAGWVRFTWHWPLARGEARELRWVDWSVRTGRQRSRPEARRRRPTSACSPRCRCSARTRSPRRTTRGTAACLGDRDRQRAREPRDQAVRQRPAAARQRRPRRGRALHRRRRALVRDPVRPRLDHRVVPVAVRPAAGRRRDPRRPRRAPGRPTRTRTATPSRARSSTSSGRARWRGPASCRSGPTTGRWTPRRCG